MSDVHSMLWKHASWWVPVFSCLMQGRRGLGGGGVTGGGAGLGTKAVRTVKLCANDAMYVAA